MIIFKITFPTGYQIEDVHNDNIDINIAVESGDVYYGTLFTLSNVKCLMIKNKESFFWATDMLIVESLELNVIREIILNCFEQGVFYNVFCKIGDIQSVYGDNVLFEELTDPSLLI